MKIDLLKLLAWLVLAGVVILINLGIVLAIHLIGFAACGFILIAFLGPALMFIAFCWAIKKIFG